MKYNDMTTEQKALLLLAEFLKDKSAHCTLHRLMAEELIKESKK